MDGPRPETILVIDDDEPLRETLRLILESEGYGVVTAANGEEGLRAVERAMPSVILLDMRMPVMDGWAFARAFRGRHGHAAPLLVNTAAEDAMRRAAEIDADGFIGKPFDLQELLAKVAQATGMRGREVA